MNLFLDPMMLNILWSIGLSLPAFMIGLNWNKVQTDHTIDHTIEKTITFLVNEGFLKALINKDGEMELVKLDDEVNDDSSRQKEDNDNT